MYYQLQAPNQDSFSSAYWAAEISGLDPQFLGGTVFEVGTGNIEKVSALISKYNLDILVESDYQPTGYTRR